MSTLTIPETGSGVTYQLTSEQVDALRSSGIVSLRRESAGHWRVRAGKYVGAARVADLEVWITPKIHIGRLLFLVGYATNGRRWREEDVHLPEAPQLVPVLAESLCRQVERALRQGLLQGYRTVDETSPVLRGRLREVDQMYRHRGQPWPLEIRHDEFTVDIPENQILRTAVDRMLRVPRVEPAARVRLRRLTARLAEAGLLRPGAPPPAWQPNRLNTRYQPALRLAELVLRATSVEYGEDGIAVAGLLLNMPTIFQDFVATALREEIEPTRGGRVVAEPVQHLDVAGRVIIKPDIVWQQIRRPAAVIDVKYKAEQPSGYPNSDLYQLLAYCTALDLNRGYLVYAAGGGQPTTHIVRNAGVEIVCHALDLTAPPDRLLSQVRNLAAGILATPNARSSRAHRDTAS